MYSIAYASVLVCQACHFQSISVKNPDLAGVGRGHAITEGISPLIAGFPGMGSPVSQSQCFGLSNIN